MKPSESQPAVIDLQSFKFVDLKEQLMENERLILRELGFSIYKLLKDNAHKWLIQLLKDVFQIQQSDALDLIQSAWNYVNDCYATICIACFPPNIVAAGCLQLALLRSESKYKTELPWWRVLNVKDEEVWLVQTEILLSYERELSQVSLTKIDCKIDLETEISKERAKSRFDKAKISNQVQPESIKNQPI